MSPSGVRPVWALEGVWPGPRPTDTDKRHCRPGCAGTCHGARLSRHQSRPHPKCGPGLIRQRRWSGPPAWPVAGRPGSPSRPAAHDAAPRSAPAGLAPVRRRACAGSGRVQPYPFGFGVAERARLVPDRVRHAEPAEVMDQAGPADGPGLRLPHEPPDALLAMSGLKQGRPDSGALRSRRRRMTSTTPVPGSRVPCRSCWAAAARTGSRTSPIRRAAAVG